VRQFKPHEPSFREAGILSVAALFVVAVLWGVAGGLAGCNDRVGSPPQAAILQAQGWVEVYENEECEPLACPGRGGIHFNTLGEVFSGPAEGPVTPIGQLTAQELEGLILSANAAADQVLSGTLTCAYWDPPVGEVFTLLRLKLEDGNGILILQKDPVSQSLCYRGARALADSLDAVIQPLVSKYGVSTAAGLQADRGTGRST
jgi:hypothetical protein